ncbi:hypothetical protein O3G_MSEX007293 [Manduca sexta]|uniref:Polynucleotide 5'-hydroxyl-kinase NOL9 n=1 Tax=Manduca sexta TaxID=7130 RepID=A0A921Z6A8_MANSE|nr:hypothetical protein O3G_MSEX007293 [Manduca sexta]
MDFFERAHVIKKPAVKTTKSDETVKKQLKQMLRGYKQNDTKIIKQAENLKIDLDDTIFSVEDSDSVSGFSDLNLTNSSNENEKSKDTISDVESVLNTSKSSSILNEEENQNKSLMQSAESISEFEDDLQSLPENTQDVTNTTMSENSDDTWDLDKTTDSNINSDSDKFDPDGALACKILKRINDRENAKHKRRKLDRIETSSDESTEHTNIIRQKEKTQNYVQLKPVEKDEDSESTDNIDTSTQDSVSTAISSPYISLTATEMTEQSLSEILGEYRHPTTRNIPCEKQNVICSMDYSEIFPTESVEVANIVTEDEVDSLVPELGDEPTVEDLEEPPNVTLEAPLDEPSEIEDTSEMVKPLDDSLHAGSVDSDVENPIKVYYGTDTCIFILKHPTKIYLHGKVKAKALGGTIEVFGYTLNNEFSEIYAPTFNFAQCIKTVECENTYYGLFRKLTSSGISIRDAEEIVTTIGEYDGVLCLSALSNKRIDFVENNFTTMDLFKKPKKYNSGDSSIQMASEFLDCSLYLTQPGRCFVENVKWEQIISCGLDNRSRAIICGGKNTGKSTFLRYYINKLVANGPILVIDLDPGQAELTVAGNVSATVVTKPLLGPNFTHLQKPDKMLNIGLISTMDSPSRYASALISLFEYCNSNENYKNMPWVVNTMGMSNNLGLKFITLTILLAQPTLLVQMDSINHKKRFEIDLHPLSVQGFLDSNNYDRIFKNVPHSEKIEYTFIISSPVELGAKTEVGLAARDQRYLNFLAYFGELMDIHTGPSILGIVPYEVKFEDINIATNASVRKEAIIRVINGKILALCQMTTPDKGRVFNLSDNPVLCLGHGLVRGVDFDKNLLYIITPVPACTLPQVNTLVYSDWVPELKGQDLQLPNGTVIPYRTTSNQKNLMTTPHRRFNPLKLLKMSRKS